MNERNESTSGSGSLASLLKDRIHEIHDLLDSVSNQLWTSIDHNDNESVRRGVELKQTFNEWRATFDSASEQLTLIAEKLPQGTTRLHSLPKTTPSANLNRRRSASISSPRMLSLRGEKVVGILNWRDAYARLLKLVYHHNPQLFDSLSSNSAFISRRGRPEFSPDPSIFISPGSAPNGLFYEANQSAESIFTKMQKIIHHFGFTSSDLELTFDD